MFLELNKTNKTNTPNNSNNNSKIIFWIIKFRRKIKFFHLGVGKRLKFHNI